MGFASRRKWIRRAITYMRLSGDEAAAYKEKWNKPEKLDREVKNIRDGTFTNRQFMRILKGAHDDSAGTGN